MALGNTGTPLVCVLMHGGSIKLGSLRTSCDAIVDAWYVLARRIMHEYARVRRIDVHMMHHLAHLLDALSAPLFFFLGILC